MRVEKLKRFIDRDYPEFIDVVRDEQYRCVKFFEDEMKTRYYIDYVRFKLLL